MLTRLPCYANCEYCVTCIPMRDTPIYAQLKAEREGRGRYSIGGWIKPDGVTRMMYDPGTEPHLKYPETAATPRSRALLKKGRKR